MLTILLTLWTKVYQSTAHIETLQRICGIATAANAALKLSLFAGLFPDYHRVRGIVIAQALAVFFVVLAATLPMTLRLTWAYIQALLRHRGGTESRDAAPQSTTAEARRRTRAMLRLATGNVLGASVCIFFLFTVLSQPDSFQLTSISVSRSPADYRALGRYTLSVSLDDVFINSLLGTFLCVPFLTSSGNRAEMRQALGIKSDANATGTSGSAIGAKASATRISTGTNAARISVSVS